MGCSSSKAVGQDSGAGDRASDAPTKTSNAPAKTPVQAPKRSASSGRGEQSDFRESEQPLIIFVLGGPGSGKGTQCARIVEKYGGGCRHLSTGELLRAEVARGSDSAKQLEKAMKSGGLVSDDQVLALLEREISERAWFGLAFLVDGFPRTLAQADAFEQRIRPPDAVIFFDCPDKELLQRLEGRGGTSGRSDDTPSIARSRLKTFHSQSQPVVSRYEAEGKLHRVSAVPPQDEVFREVEKLLDSLFEVDGKLPGAGAEWRPKQLTDIEKRFYGDRD